jgi:translation initiation factor 3 subunit C
LRLAARACRFLAGSSDSDSDDERRVVLRSNRDKRLSELSDTCDEIRVSGCQGQAAPKIQQGRPSTRNSEHPPSPLPLPALAPQNKMKINDWSSIQSLFDELGKRLERFQKASSGVGTPKMYIKVPLPATSMPCAAEAGAVSGRRRMRL